jgi:lipopolysaccharide export LptBFGC system permease protein LptF
LSRIEPAANPPNYVISDNKKPRPKRRQSLTRLGERLGGETWFAIALSVPVITAALALFVLAYIPGDTSPIAVIAVIGIAILVSFSAVFVYYDWRIAAPVLGVIVVLFILAFIALQLLFHAIF